MSVEALALAVLSALRPTALAAVYALLAAPRPSRPLAAYTIAGLASSIVGGVVVVAVLHGVRVETGTSTANAVIELVGGAAALGFAAAIVSGRWQTGSRTTRTPGDSRLVRRLREPSMRIAAGAGIATHLPGLFYLLGLNAIAAGDPPLAQGIVSVLIFDAIWLAIPIGALVVSVRRPADVRDAVGRVSAWMHSRQRAILTLALIVVGAYFTTRGVIDLLG